MNTAKRIVLYGSLILGMALSAFPVYGQQSAVKRQPGDIVHYKVTFEGGDVAGITEVTLNFWTGAPTPQNQQGLTNGFTGHCKKSSTPNVFECSASIPDNIQDGDYTITYVGVTAGNFSKRYEGDFHIPSIPFKNPNTFNFPSKVTVTEQH